MIPNPGTYQLQITPAKSEPFTATLKIETSNAAPFGGTITIDDRWSPINGRVFPLDLCQVDEQEQQVVFRLKRSQRIISPSASRNPLLYLFVGTWVPDTGEFQEGKVTLPQKEDLNDPQEDPIQDADWQGARSPEQPDDPAY